MEKSVLFGLLLVMLYEIKAQRNGCSIDMMVTHCSPVVLQDYAPLDLGTHTYVLHFGMDPNIPGKHQVQVLKSDMFLNLGDITTLEMDGIGLETIEPGAFLCLENLRRLSLKENKLLKHLAANTFEGMPNLDRLEFESSGIEEIDAQAFAGLNKLTFISFVMNNIIEIQPGAFETLPALTELRLDFNNLGNNLVAENFRGLGKLKTLNVGGNHISFLPDDILVGMPNLERIHLYDNEIREINTTMFKNHSKVTTVLLSKNKICSLPPTLSEDLPQLEHLDLERNELHVLKSGMFDGLINLKRLILSKNHIESIENEAFRGLEKMERCELAFNEFFHDTDWEQVLSHVTNLYRFLLSPENFECEEYEKLYDMMIEKGGRLVGVGRGHCINEASE